MKRIALVAALVAALTACASDRGKCLSGHNINLPPSAHSVTRYVNGEQVTITEFRPAGQQFVCLQWERP